MRRRVVDLRRVVLRRVVGLRRDTVLRRVGLRRVEGDLLRVVRRRRVVVLRRAGAAFRRRVVALRRVVFLRAGEARRRAVVVRRAAVVFLLRVVFLLAILLPPLRELAVVFRELLLPLRLATFLAARRLAGLRGFRITTSSRAIAIKLPQQASRYKGHA